MQNRRAVDYSYWLNNIVVADGLGSDDDLFHVECNGNQGTNHTIDYNLYWSLSGDPSSTALWNDPDNCNSQYWSGWNTLGYDTNGLVDNPDFVDASDFELQSYSPAVDAGGWLSYVSSTSGTTITVGNTYIFHGRMGMTDEMGNPIEGQLISFYDSTNGRQDREIVSVNYGTSITIDSSIDYIYNGSYPNDPDYTTQISLRFTGDAPDIGAVEYQSQEAPPEEQHDITVDMR